MQRGDNNHPASSEPVNYNICYLLDGTALITDFLYRTCKYLLGSNRSHDFRVSARIVRVLPNGVVFCGLLPDNELGLGSEEVLPWINVRSLLPMSISARGKTKL